MKLGLAAVLFGLGATGAALAAEEPGAKKPKQSFEVMSTQRVRFPPGGSIRLENSYGYLAVEGWDEPEVEVTVIKSTNNFEKPDWKIEADRRFEQIRVVTERRSDKELAISTTLPRRTNLVSSILPERRVVFTLPKRSKRGVTVEYRLRVPRDSRLVVHHDNGYVWVSGVTGDMEVASHTGDMIVMLPGPGPYSIDARTGMGRVSSDLPGEAHKHFLVNTNFARSEAASRRVTLRMGRGSITIKTGAASAPWGKN